jgi:hypothetical protein
VDWTRVAGAGPPVTEQEGNKLSVSGLLRVGGAAAILIINRFFRLYLHPDPNRRYHLIISNDNCDNID